MRKELKKAIIDFIFENEKEFQLTNATVKKFRPYIYDEEGNFLIGGKETYNFVNESILLITKN